MLKKKVISMFVIILVLLISACSNGTNETNKESASPSTTPASTTSEVAPPEEPVKTVELRMFWWGSDERHEKTLKAIELFEQKNKGIKITSEYSGFDGYMVKLNTQIAAGNAPDLIQMGGNIKEYVDKKAMLDLTPYVGNVINLEGFNPTLVESATFDSKLYGVTLGVSSSGLLYNASMFEKAGVEVPTESWTYDELKTTSIAITEKLGKGNYGVYDLSSDAATLGSYLGSNGKELYRDGARLFEKEDIISWFTIWEELRAAGAVVPADVQVASPSSAVDKSLVVKGQVAIQSVAASQIYGYQELTEDTLGLIMFPNGSAGSGMIPPISGQYITSYSSTELKRLRNLLTLW
ncbi:multiple sugar transport system substrate-binding protein [Paenibacillus sp. DS2015]|uniref:ABC transporter substrate-binding protein n=1 Tax=Paenibacillus sp. DS2015 TaxID=3373917 RepID=UPI003D1D076D